MFDKKNNPQLELFRQTEKETGASDGFRSFSLLSEMKNHEKPVILAILFIATGIACFSLGVKKGMAIALKQPASMVNLAGKRSAEISPLAAEEYLTKKNSEIAQKAAVITEKPGLKTADLAVSENYAIQVASFRTSKNAEKEASFLKKKGFSAIIRNKGEYAVVYVGVFPDRKKADSVLKELKKQYRDCLIRRI